MADPNPTPVVTQAARNTVKRAIETDDLQTLKDQINLGFPLTAHCDVAAG